MNEQAIIGQQIRFHTRAPFVANDNKESNPQNSPFDLDSLGDSDVGLLCGAVPSAFST